MNSVIAILQMEREMQCLSGYSYAASEWRVVWELFGSKAEMFESGLKVSQF